MAGINVNDVVGVQIHGELFSQRTISTFWYRCLVASTNANYVQAITGVAENFDQGVISPGLAFVAVAPQNWTWVFTRAQVVNPTRKVYAESNVDLPGTWPVGATTANTQASITRRSEIGTRRNVGALHTPGLPTDAQVAGELSVGYKAALATLGTRMLNIFEHPFDATLELQPILWSPSTPTDATRVITSTIVQDRVGTMHRRTVRLGI